MVIQYQILYVQIILRLLDTSEFHRVVVHSGHEKYASVRMDKFVTDVVVGVPIVGLPTCIRIAMEMGFLIQFAQTQQGNSVLSRAHKIVAQTGPMQNAEHKVFQNRPAIEEEVGVRIVEQFIH